MLLIIALIAIWLACRPHVNPIMLDADPFAHCHSLTAPPILELRHDAKNCMPSKMVLAQISAFDPRFNHGLTQNSRNSASSSFFCMRFLCWLVVITSLGASHIIVLGDSTGLVPFLQHGVGPSAMTGPRLHPCTAIENSRAIDGSFARFHMEFCSSVLRSAVIFCHGRVAPTLNVVRNFVRRLWRSRLQQNRANVQRLTACAVFALCISTLPLRIEGLPYVRTPEACDAWMQIFIFMFLYNCVRLRWLGLWCVLLGAIIKFLVCSSLGGAHRLVARLCWGGLWYDEGCARRASCMVYSIIRVLF